MTRYEKRDRSGYFVNSAFLVRIVSVMSVEFNGASLKKKYCSQPELCPFFLTRVARCQTTIFRDTGVFILLPVLPGVIRIRLVT